MNKIYSNQARQIGILKPIANLCNGLSAFSFQLFVLFALALQLLSFRSNAQQYPVQVTPVLLPPYSLRLADYATTTDTKLQLYLLMRDLLEPSHQVRLRFSLESGINASPIAYSTPLVTGFKDVTLYPGTPLVLTNVDLRALFDLQNLSGISAADYARPLPQGIYRFSFQAFDAITQRTLSAKSFATAYFVQYDPPRLSLPQQGEKVLKQNEFQRIIFQWMPSQVAPNTKYIFTLKELWDNERDPVAGFLSSRALWQEEVYPNTLLYGIDKTALIPGKRYAWQVQAKSGNLVMGGSPTEDNGVYRNNGLSEIFYFDYVEDCLVPSFLMAKNVGRGRTEIRWNVTGSKPDGLYRIQYRKRGSTGAWEQQESYQEMATLTGLEDVTAYEYRVGSVCGNLYQTNASNPATGNDPTGNAYAYSGIQNFTTDARGSQNTNYQCGVMPPVDITNSSPLQTALGVNEVFMAGDFPVTVLEAQGSNGTYSGKGYIQVPYLADTRIKVEFNNIRLNTDMKLIGGVIETSYDPNETSVKFVSDGIGETFGDQGIKEVKVAYTISKIEYVATPPPGKIVVSGNSGTGNANDTGSGTPSQQELPAGKDYAIIDKSGKIWNVDESGAVNEAGQEAKGGTSTAANTQGVTGTGSNTQVSGYTAKGIKIKWQESSLDTTFAFDTEEKTKLGEKGNYPKLKDADGNTVYVPFKAVVNGQTGYLDAKISIGDPSLKDAEIIFKTLKVGKAIDAKLQGKTDVERTYQLTLKGVMDYAEEEVLAVLMPKDSTGKQQVIGSFRLVHLSPKTVNVTLVPTDEASKAKLKTQGDELKRIYEKIGVKFVIREDPILDISSVVSGNTINSEDADLMSTYSEQQQQINALYKGTDDRYVVFVTDKTSSTGQNGYMRLNGQFGYVYQNATGKTTAHELGHGVFKLEHPWRAYGTTKGTTNLLMDYGKGDELSHLEWKQVNDPALKIYSFQGQSSGELGGGFGLAPDFTFISTNTNQVLPDATIVADPFVGGFVSTNVDRSEEHYYWKNTRYETKDGKPYAKPKLILKDESVIWLLVNNGKNCEERRFIKTAYKEIKSFINASPRDINGLQSYIANHKDIPINPTDLTQKVYGGSLGCGKTGNGTSGKGVTKSSTDFFARNGQGLRTVDENGDVVDYSGKFTKEDIQEMLGRISFTSTSTGIKGKIFITDENTQPVDREKVQARLNQPLSKELVIWLDVTDSKTKTFEIKINAGSGLPQFKEKSTQELLNILKKNNFWFADIWIPDFNPLTAVLDGLAELIGKGTIPERFYNPDATGYNPLPANIYSFVSLTIVNDGVDSLIPGLPGDNKFTPSRVSFAFTSGVWNGLVGTVEAIPSGISGLIKINGSIIDVIVNQDGARVKFIKTIKGLNWDKLKDLSGSIGAEIGKGWDKYTINPCMRAYSGGQAAFVVASFFIGAGEANAATTFLKALDKLDIAGQMMGKVFSLAGKVIKPVLNASSGTINFLLQETTSFVKRVEIKLPSNLYCGLPYLELRIRDRFENLTANEIADVEQQIIRQLDDPSIPIDDEGKRLLEVDINNEKILVVVGPEDALDKLAESAKSIYKTVEELVKSIVGNRSLIRKNIIDLAESKALAKAYFEHIGIKDMSFDDWFEQVYKKYEGNTLNFEAHHIIPINVLEKNRELKALLLWAEQNGKGIDFNGIENGMMLQKKSIRFEVDGHANHPEYDERINLKINFIITVNAGNNVDALAEIKQLIKKTKATLKNDVLLGTKNVNEIDNF